MRKKRIVEIHQRKAVSTSQKRSVQPYPIIAAPVGQPDEVKLQQDTASLLDDDEPLTEQDLAKINTVLTHVEEVLSRTAERLDRIHNTAVDIVAELRAARGLRATNPGEAFIATGP